MATKKTMSADSVLANQIYNDEIIIAQSNQDWSDNNYESYLGILDNVRDDKKYEWQSDIRIPEFISHFLSQAAIDVGQYFGTRDFVEVKINDKADEAKKSAEASKELLNRTLNKRELLHYQKFVRGKGICNLSGRVYLKCWWEQAFEERQIGTKFEIYDGQEIEVPVFENVAVIDRFNYDVWDQRNVFVSDDYAYTLQQKEWITFRSETTKADLEIDAEKNEYFNLELIGDAPETTDTKQETYQGSASPDGQTKENQSKAEHQYDLFERYGKYWVLETKKGIEIGIDENGAVLDNATYEDVIITIVKSSESKTLIGFKRTHFIDAHGMPFKPCMIGLCYIHPNDDKGMGDGQNQRELQTALDDTFNASQDRVILSTFPSLKGARQSIEDNSSIYIEPGHTMMLEDVNDVQELNISSDISGALNQMQYLENKGRQADSMNETTTGGVPSIASTTATAVSAATSSSNTRVNYKSMTFEYTALLELYWMIQQMTYRFATDKTGFELMGDKLYDFNPTLDYYYTPLSQSIETESSKATKIRDLNTLLQTTINIQHPDAVKTINFLYREIFKLMGDEYENVAQLDENTPVQSGGQQGKVEGDSASNQYGLQQSATESGARMNAAT